MMLVDNPGVDRQNYVEYAPPRRNWLLSQVRSVLSMMGAGATALATIGHAWRVAPFQVEYPQIDMPLRGLAGSFSGFRIIQFTDLHTGFRTPTWFLRQVVARINEMKPDLVAVTGDLITHVKPHVKEAVDIVAGLRGRVVVTFGNHDYTRNFHPWSGSDLADEFQGLLSARGIPLLRNQAMSIDHPDGRLWIVGLEDLWSGRFSPQRALAGVISCDEPVIALSHNPDTVFALEQCGIQWVLAGHTHGGQIRVPLAGPLVLPVRHKQFAFGLFEVGRTRMYVSRGVGFRVRVRFRCRPEVPCFRLTPAGNRTQGSFC